MAEVGRELPPQLPEVVDYRTLDVGAWPLHWGGSRLRSGAEGCEITLVGAIAWVMMPKRSLK